MSNKVTFPRKLVYFLISVCINDVVLLISKSQTCDFYILSLLILSATKSLFLFSSKYLSLVLNSCPIAANLVRLSSPVPGSGGLAKGLCVGAEGGRSGIRSLWAQVIRGCAV